jgi:hypothetical protein
MDLDRGTLARIDRSLMAGLEQDVTFRMVRVPVTEAKWSTWKRHCDAAGISMGRAIMALIERELVTSLVILQLTVRRCLRSEPRSGSQLERRTSLLVSVMSRPLRSGYVGGTTGCDSGMESSRFWSSESRWLPSWHLGQLRPRRRSAATNDARADQVSSTSIVTAWPDAGPVAHSAG